MYQPKHARQYPSPTVELPDDTIAAIMDEDDGALTATDGCGPIEPDGECEHGHPSWLIELGMI